MTAEIAIMNQSAVALAADSAITSGMAGREKIFSNDTKLYALSRHHPVGIMVYGRADFMRVPMETIIKLFREELGDESLPGLVDYAEEFLAYLDRGNPMFPKEVQKDFLVKHVRMFYTHLTFNITCEVQKVIKEEGKISHKRVGEIVEEMIDEEYDTWREAPRTPGLPRDFESRLMKKHKTAIGKLRKEEFEKLPVSRSAAERLKRLTGCLFTRFPDTGEDLDGTGIVIAGFGDDDIFPALQAMEIRCVAENRLIFSMDDTEEIDYETDASIFPFAQTGMVELFLEGIGPVAKEFVEENKQETLKAFAKEAIAAIEKERPPLTEKQKARIRRRLEKTEEALLERHDDEVEEFIEGYAAQFGSVISMLPKEELAKMAETLVSLTSFKRRMSWGSESVGGPVDVAVISKGDGFVWVRRKQYFPPGLNSSHLLSRTGGESCGY